MTVDDLMALHDKAAAAWHANQSSREPEQAAGPVAHMWQHPETGRTGFVEHGPQADLDNWERMNKPRKIVAPLYASPPKREPLTEEQIDAALVSVTKESPIWMRFTREQRVIFARAIERAHGIGDE